MEGLGVLRVYHLFEAILRTRQHVLPISLVYDLQMLPQFSRSVSYVCSLGWEIAFTERNVNHVIRTVAIS